jgi:hypothetical protein
MRAGPRPSLGWSRTPRQSTFGYRFPSGHVEDDAPSCPRTDARADSPESRNLTMDYCRAGHRVKQEIRVAVVGLRKKGGV